MKIVLLNAATLPIYRDELTPLLLEADTSDSAPEAEAFFHELRAALSRNQRLLWIARDEHGVIGTVQLDLDAEKPSDQCGTVSTLVVDSTARRRGVGKQLMRELENTAFTLRRELLSLDIEAGTPAEAFYRAQGYRCSGKRTSNHQESYSSRQGEMVYYKRLIPSAPLPHEFAN
ncbi:GNAT family N-acetyltransferase [Rouxiella badensis]|nr:GNAT family N-acetyltransferase [Rouxiella badensis]